MHSLKPCVLRYRMHVDVPFRSILLFTPLGERYSPISTFSPRRRATIALLPRWGARFWGLHPRSPPSPPSSSFSSSWLQSDFGVVASTPCKNCALASVGRPIRGSSPIGALASTPCKKCALASVGRTFWGGLPPGFLPPHHPSIHPPTSVPPHPIPPHLR